MKKTLQLHKAIKLGKASKWIHFLGSIWDTATLVSNAEFLFSFSLIIFGLGITELHIIKAIKYFEHFMITRVF